MKKNLVMRRCISCRSIKDRKTLLKITNDHELGILVNSGMGRSAYVCKEGECSKDSKFKKNLQRALRVSIDPSFHEIIAIEIENYK